MKRIIVTGIIVLVVAASSRVFGNNLNKLNNPQIDYDGFLSEARDVKEKRKQRLVSAKKFIQMAREPNTIILDARNPNRYALKHIKGAKHLDFTDFTVDNLAKVIPSKDTRVLIYCNNNFVNDSPAFASKMSPMALNIPTFINLYSYGYKNVYELGEALDENNTVLEFESGIHELSVLK